jgi:hypothetical protein
VVHLVQVDVVGLESTEARLARPSQVVGGLFTDECGVSTARRQAG